MVKSALLTSFMIALQLSCFAQSNWDPNNPLELGAVDLHSKETVLVHGAAAFISNRYIRSSDTADKAFFINAYSEVQQKYSQPHSDFFMFRIAAGQQLKKWVATGLELDIMKVRDPQVSSVGINGLVFFNWYLVNKPNFQFFFEPSYGVIQFTREFPAGGSKFNFTSLYGFGSNVKIKDTINMHVGIRHMHISNAYLFGDDKNPASDSIGGYIGFNFK